MKSSVDNDRQFELDALGCSQPLKASKSICNMLRATKTGDRPSCRVENRLETVKQAGWEASQLSSHHMLSFALLAMLAIASAKF